MKIDKKTLMPVIVLVSICVIVAALLGAINMLTAPEIEKNALKKEQEALFEVFPDEEDGFDKVENLNGLPKTVSAVYKAKGGKGYVVSLATTTNYSSGDMTFAVGIDNDGKILGAKLTGYYESKDFGKETYPLGFVGKTETDYEDVAVTTGVTYSSNAFKAAIGDAFTAVAIANGEEVEAPSGPEMHAREESEILPLLQNLVQNSTGFTKMELDGEFENLVSVYKENSGKGYVAYVLAVSPNYGTVESEALIHIENNGKIKNVLKLTWKTSDAMYGYVPPTQEEADAFFGRFGGQSSDTLDGVELVTNATSTSTRVLNSFKEALREVEAFISKDMPTPEEEIKTLAAALANKELDLESLTLEDSEYLRRLYKDKNRNGYFAYVVVISKNYGTVESEALIHIGNDGKIKGINKLTWKTSDAMYGYVPPTADAVDAFYSRLNGTDSSSIGGVELVTNATNTSTNVVNSFKEALDAANAAIKKDMPTSEEDLFALASALVGEEVKLLEVTPKDAEYLRRLYKDENGNGYLAYVVVISKNYGTVESEALIHIGNNGKIKGINKLTWKTSDAMYGYVPPTADVVDAFYSRLNGTDSSSIGGVELVTNATNTSTNVVNSFKEALSAVDAIEVNYAPRVIGIVVLSLLLIGSVAVFVIFRKRRAPYEK